KHFSAEIRARGDDHGEGHHEAQRRRGLQPAGVVTTAFVGDVLGDIGYGAAIFAPQAEALNHPQPEQDERGGETDLLVGRDQPNAPRAKTHSGQRNEERVFAADPVAHPSEQECSQRADQESRCEQRDPAQQRRDRMALFEELDRQDRGQAAENVEVIPFDDVSHRRGDDHAPEIPWDLNRACSSHSHLSSPYCLALSLHSSSLRGRRMYWTAPQRMRPHPSQLFTNSSRPYCNGPSLDPRPPRAGSETMKKGIIAGGAT